MASAGSYVSPRDQKGWCLPTPLVILELGNRRHPTRGDTRGSVHRHRRPRRAGTCACVGKRQDACPSRPSARSQARSIWSSRRDFRVRSRTRRFGLMWTRSWWRAWMSTAPVGARRAKPALIQRAGEGDPALRSSRLLAGAEEAGGGRSPSRSREAPCRPDPGDGARLWADPSSAAGSDRRHAPPLPNETTVLELLRPRHCDSLELGLGPGGRRRLDQRALPRRGASRANTIAS